MQQEFFETFVEHCPAAVAVLDREMKYLSVSKRWLSNFGLLDQNLTGKCHYDVFPDVPERWRRIHQQCLGGQVEKCDLDVFPRADGSTEWLRWEVRPWRDGSGDIGGIVMFSEVLTDIIETKERLRAREQLLSFVGKSAQVGGWEFDIVKGTGAWTEQVAAIYERDPNQEANLDLMLSLHCESDRKKLEEAIRKGLADRAESDLELRIVTPGGREKWVNFRCYPRLRKGKVNGLQCSIQDITKQRDYENALLSSKNRFKLLAELAELLLNKDTTDPDLQVLYTKIMNHLDCQVFFHLALKEDGKMKLVSQTGLSAEQADRVADIGERMDCPLTRGTKCQCPSAEGGQLEELELTAWTCQPLAGPEGLLGTLFFGSRTRGSFSDDEEQLISTVCSQMAVFSQRVRTQKKLSQSEATFRAMFELSALGKGQADPQTGRIIRVNKRLCEITGFSDEELKRMTIGDLTHPLDRERDAKGVKKVLESGISGYNVEKRYLCKGGRVAWVHVHATVIRDESGTPLTSIAVVEDITKRKQAEEEARALENQVRQVQKLDAIGQLAGGVAHDFNNILSSILMQADLAKLRSESNPGCREALDQIVRDTQRAAKLTGQLLLFSRKQVLQMGITDLNAVVSNLVEMLRRIVREDVTLELDLPAQPSWVQADVGMMEQVVTNLVINARDAMPEGGLVVLELSHVSKIRGHDAEETAPDGYVRLTVRDTGCGIPEENMGSIFDPFFTTKLPGEGTGLGLSTVFGIVSQHSGHIQVDSETGVGSVFHVYLPRRQAPVSSPEPKHRPPSPVGKETILLVEDSLEVRRVLAEILRIRGYVVLQAENGAQAISVWETEGPDFDLLLTDIVMPGGISGRELAAHLRKEKPDLKILFMSGYSPDSAGRELHLNEGESFLQKPFQSNELLSTVRSCLDE